MNYDRYLEHEQYVNEVACCLRAYHAGQMSKLDELDRRLRAMQAASTEETEKEVRE